MLVEKILACEKEDSHKKKKNKNKKQLPCLAQQRATGAYTFKPGYALAVISLNIVNNIDINPLGICVILKLFKNNGTTTQQTTAV